jgi:hypothetical protein
MIPRGYYCDIDTLIWVGNSVYVFTQMQGKNLWTAIKIEDGKTGMQQTSDWYYEFASLYPYQKGHEFIIAGFNEFSKHLLFQTLKIEKGVYKVDYLLIGAGGIESRNLCELVNFNESTIGYF